MYASSGDEDLKNNANTVVAELGKCQAALKSGYLSAFPVEFFDRLRERQRVWAPFYTIHKIMAGLLDMYVYCGNEQALDMVQKMAGWTAGYTGSLSYEHMQRVLGTEFGGMGEVLSNLYAVTGKDYYLEVAQRFDKKQFFDPLAAHRDELKGLHVNTHIPQVIAAARYYELTGDRRYRDIAEYFWDEVVSERSYCTGGTSNGESWNTDPGKLSTELSANTTECCCAYNMMKLTRHLFGWTPDARLMDYYERTLFNHRLGTINPEDGTMMYYLPLAAGYWKTFGKPFDALWCCTGTGSEEYGKLTDTIYFHDDDSLYVNLYIDSQLEWPEKGLRVKQETRFPEEQGTTITVTAQKSGAACDQPSHSILGARRQRENQRSCSARVCQPEQLSHAQPRLENRRQDRTQLADGPSYRQHARRRDHPGRDVWPSGAGRALRRSHEGDDATAITNRNRATRKKCRTSSRTPTKPTAWIEPDAKQPLTFHAVGQSQPLTLVPLYKVIHERYAVYWKVDNKTA